MSLLPLRPLRLKRWRKIPCLILKINKKINADGKSIGKKRWKKKWPSLLTRELKI